MNLNDEEVFQMRICVHMEILIIERSFEFRPEEKENKKTMKELKTLKSILEKTKNWGL